VPLAKLAPEHVERMMIASLFKAIDLLIDLPPSTN
jgi:hypothetical protein